jgi:2-amino-4-hydroxy-6-hydroxymethyldihydropteridine diphosphokinase
VPPAPASRTIALAAGSNLGDAAASIRRAFDALRTSPHIRAPRLSPLYRTAAVRVTPTGPDPGGEFVNAAVVAESSASPQELLALLHEIERRGGRDRAVSLHGGPRPLDLDLLMVGDLTLATPELTLPHPRMHERAFVLVPLADVAPNLVVPGSGWGRTVAELLARLGPLDAGAVRRIEP